jgi:hypothetical protein
MSVSKKRVPRILFTYWSGDTLSLLHIITLRAVKLLNPSYKVILYSAKKEQTLDRTSFNSLEHSVVFTKQYTLQTLSEDSQIEISEIDLCAEYGIKNPLFHTFIADIVRIKKLEEHGGIWFDMDLLFLKGISDEFLETLPQGKSCATVSYSGTIATGFVFGFEKAELFKKLSIALNRKLKDIHTDSIITRYQALGPSLWQSFAKPYFNEALGKHPLIHSIPKEDIYPYIWNEMNQLFLESSECRVNDSTLAIHWYNGSSETRNFINDLYTKDLNNVGKSPMLNSLLKLRDLGVSLEEPKIV